MNIQLFHHQKVSLNRMQELEETNASLPNMETKIGFLSDIAGYGKTITVISLILEDLMSWSCEAPFEQVVRKSFCSSLVQRKETRFLKRLRASLILIPKNLLGQWREELSRTDLCVQHAAEMGDLSLVRPDVADIVLCTNNMFNKLIMSYSECAWKRVVVDEPSAVRIPSMKTPIAGFYWFVTATPQLFYSAHHSASRGSFFREIIGELSAEEFRNVADAITIRNDAEFVRTSFDMPSTNYVSHFCYYKVFKVVQHFINDRVRVLIESGDIRGAILALGGKNCDNIVDLVRLKKQQEVMELDARTRLYKIRNNGAMIEELTRRRARIEDQITGLEARFREMLAAPCPVCLMPISKPLLESTCQNLFCSACILEWLKTSNSCPICRSVVHPESLVLLSDKSAETTAEQPLYLNKFQTISAIVEGDGKRVLIFSASDAPFETIAAVLRDKKLQCERGNTSAAIEAFKKGAINALFLNSKTSSTGLDLHEATDIILFHQMDTDMEYQIVSRANRIGRKNSLNVHRLIFI